MNKKYDVKRSYFGRYKKPNGISIARGMPKGWDLKRCIPELFPTWAMIKGKLGHDEFTRQYHKYVLDKLDPYKILEKANGMVMLCWETPDKFCHRETVANWIEKETGIVVPEFSFEFDNKPKEIEQLSLIE